MVRAINANEKKELLELEPTQFTFDKLIELFGTKISKKDGKATMVKSRFEPEDTMVLAKDEYFNKSEVKTTVGKLIFNKILVERDLVSILGYVNTTVNGGELKNIDDVLANALLMDTITVETMVKYLNRIQWLSMRLHPVICGSYTLGILKPLPEMQKFRDSMLKDNKEKIEKGDLLTVVQIEKESLAVAVEKIKNDPGMDIFLSGARGSLGNNYKNISVMKGPVYNPSTGKFDIVKSNLMEGIRKEELPIFGNAIVSGAYPKAIGTATSGYFSKQIIAALQAVVLDVPGSDCKTVLTIEHKLEKGNLKDFRFRYINDGGKLVLLDDDVIEKYKNTFIKLRSPMTCAGKSICSKCAGEMYYLLGIKNAGMTASRAASTLLNMDMKKFHDATAKTVEVDRSSMFL